MPAEKARNLKQNLVKSAHQNGHSVRKMNPDKNKQINKKIVRGGPAPLGGCPSPNKKEQNNEFHLRGFR